MISAVSEEIEPLYKILRSIEKQYFGIKDEQLVRKKSEGWKLFRDGVVTVDGEVKFCPAYKNQLVQKVLAGEDSFFSAFERFRETGSPHDLNNLQSLVPNASVIRGERGFLYKLEKFLCSKKATNESGWVTTLYLQVDAQMFADRDPRWGRFSIDAIPKRTPGMLWKTKGYFHEVHQRLMQREYDSVFGDYLNR